MYLGAVCVLNTATGEVSSSRSHEAMSTADSIRVSMGCVFMTGFLFGITEQYSEEKAYLESEIIIQDVIVA